MGIIDAFSTPSPAGAYPAERIIMEKIKFGMKQYELVPGGVDTFTANQAIITFQLGSETLDDVETMVNDISNTQRIEVLDDEGSLMQPLMGYTVLKSVEKIKNYVVEIKPTAEEVRADVAVIVLTKSDIRTDVSKVKADLEYVAMMTDVELEA